MADMKTRLRRAATEAVDPADREWAASRYNELYGPDQGTGKGMMRGQYQAEASRPSLDPLDAAIQRRAQEQQEAEPSTAVRLGRRIFGPEAEAGIRGAAQGASGGFADEIGAVAHTYGLGGFGSGGIPNFASVADAANRRQNAGDPSGMRTYREARDASRAADQQAAETNPLAYYPGLIGGALMMPGPKVGGGSVMGRMVKAGAKGAGEGAVYGAGQSESDDVAGVLRDAGQAGALGAGLSAAGQGVSESIKGVGKHISKNLKKRVVNEFAEGLESKTTPTQQKHLDRAQEDIFREVSTGPDAKAVRGTVYKGAAEGREALKPIVDEVGKANKANYGAFMKAGRGEVDAADYMMRLADRASEADEVGDVELFEAINSLIDDVDKAYQRTNSLSLTRLRGMTTKVQKHAASAVGGLNTHAAAELEGRLMATATEAMDDSLSIAAAGNPALEKAAQSIRENNRRIYALKTIDKGLQLREHKETAGPGVLQRIARAAGTPGAAAGAGYALSEDEDKLGNAAMAGAIGLGAKGLVPLAKLAQRKITDMGIATQMPGYSGPTAEGLSRAVRPFVPPLSLSLLDALMQRRNQENNQ